MSIVSEKINENPIGHHWSNMRDQLKLMITEEDRNYCNRIASNSHCSAFRYENLSLCWNKN